MRAIAAGARAIHFTCIWVSSSYRHASGSVASPLRDSAPIRGAARVIGRHSARAPPAAAPAIPLSAHTTQRVKHENP